MLYIATTECNTSWCNRQGEKCPCNVLPFVFEMAPLLMNSSFSSDRLDPRRELPCH